jgi:hypothetical protein
MKMQSTVDVYRRRSFTFPVPSTGVPSIPKYVPRVTNYRA